MKKKKNTPVSTKPLAVRLYTYRWFYVMFLPVLVFIIIFNYLPLAGLRYMFYSYTSALSIEWVGLANIQKLMGTSAFWTAFVNTLELSIVKLLLNTFMAVIISLLLNEMVNIYFKKITQTIIYLPHFMSWVVTASVFTLILAKNSSGLVNTLLINIGILEDGEQIYFLGSNEWWRFSYYLINIWKDTGWGTIIFLATLAGISPELYEAAQIDGANRWNRMRYITLPALANTIITVLILNLAKIMNLFESVFVLTNKNVTDVSQVLQTYTYDITFTTATDYGFSTAVGFFRSLVGCILVLICNYASKKVRGRGIV
ncbi:MAG: ABC transporter permease [Lachnospiraceae bacterium]